MAFRHVDSSGRRGTAESFMQAPPLPAGFQWLNSARLGEKPLWRAVPKTQAKGDSNA